MKQRLIVVGAGMAGLWAAVGAARTRQLFGKEKECTILLMNEQSYHGLRPCYYEANPQRFIYPLAEIASEIGIELVVEKVQQIDPKLNTVTTDKNRYAYDALILAAGSQLNRLPSFENKKNLFDIDTFSSAQQLEQHLPTLATHEKPGRFTAVVVGAGFCGLEIATELVGRLKKIARQVKAEAEDEVNVILLDRNQIGHGLGEKPQPTILTALTALGIKCLSEVTVNTINDEGVVLSNGITVPTQTIIWTIGLSANPLTQCFEVNRTQQGQLDVNQYLQLPGYPLHYAAGDVAHVKVDETHYALMSCQHARPQGRISGYNVVAELYGKPLIEYEQKEYVTCLDLGDWGAVFTQGFDRVPTASGESAKKIKMYINHERIGPPTPFTKASLFSAAEPVIQATPQA